MGGGLSRALEVYPFLVNLRLKGYSVYERSSTEVKYHET